MGPFEREVESLCEGHGPTLSPAYIRGWDTASIDEPMET